MRMMNQRAQVEANFVSSSSSSPSDDKKQKDEQLENMERNDKVPLRHRHDVSSSSSSTPSFPNRTRQQQQQQQQQKKHNSQIKRTMILLPPFLLLLLYLLPTSLLSTTLKARYSIYAVLSTPFLFILSVIFAKDASMHERLIGAAFASSTIMNQLSFGVCAFVAASVLLWFGLSSQPVNTTSHLNKKNDENDDDKNKIKKSLLADGKVRATLAAFSVIVALLLENFLIWAVAASYTASHNSTPTPLQDNGRILLSKLSSAASLSKHDLQSIRDFLNVPWSLVASLATSFICVELHLVKNRSLWGLALRALLSLALARTCRGISFSLTVLPSQISNCYSKKFPNPPPEDWPSWIMVGLKPMAHGGCNDLIISGHATITSLFACISTSVSGNAWFNVAVWFLLSVDFLVEMYQGLHYSVDMFLGGVITSLLWKCMAFCEVDAHLGKQTRFVPIEKMSVVDVVKYAIPTYVAWMVLTFGSSFTANGSIYVYLVVSICFAVKSGGYTHYVQHLLLCILYVALGVYL